jgi:hypothetical protein
MNPELYLNNFVNAFNDASDKIAILERENEALQKKYEAIHSQWAVEQRINKSLNEQKNWFDSTLAIVLNTIPEIHWSKEFKEALEERDVY